MPWSDPALSRPQSLWPPWVARYSEFLWFLCCSYFPGNIFGIFVFWITFSILSQNSVLLYCETERYCILLYPSCLFLMKMFIGSPRPGTWNLLLLLSNFLKATFMLNQISLTVQVEGQTHWSSAASFCFAFELILLNCPLIFFFKFYLFFLPHLWKGICFVTAPDIQGSQYSGQLEMKSQVHRKNQDALCVYAQPGQPREFCWSVHQICSKSKSRAWVSLLFFFPLNLIFSVSLCKASSFSSLCSQKAWCSLFTLELCHTSKLLLFFLPILHAPFIEHPVIA